MSNVSARLKVVDRVALALLCLILAAAVSTRFYSYGIGGAGVADQTSDAVDLGAGVSLPRATSVSRRVQIGSCSTPATIHFVSPSWVGVDPSTVTSPDLDDRIFYAYRGTTLGGRFAWVELIMVYVARLASGLLSMSRHIGATDLAVKIIVPAGCDATPDKVLVALRRQVQAR